MCNMLTFLSILNKNVQYLLLSQIPRDATELLNYNIKDLAMKKDLHFKTMFGVYF